AGTVVEPERRVIVLVDFQKNDSCAETGEPTQVQIEHPARNASAALTSGDGDRQDLRFVFDEPRHDKPGKSRAAHRAVREHMTVDQQAFAFWFVPAAPERGGMQRRDRGGIACAGFRQRRLTARKKAAKKTDHRRASCTASCGWASAARR